MLRTSGCVALVWALVTACSACRDFGLPERDRDASKTDAGSSKTDAGESRHRLQLTGPATFVEDSCAGPFSVALTDTRDVSVVAEANHDIALDSDGAITFSSDQDCTSSVTSRSLASGRSSVTFFARADAATALTLTASSSDLEGDSLVATVTAAPSPGFCDEPAYQNGTPFASGSGTSASPYTLCTPAQLDQVRNQLDRHFRLESDLVLSSYTGFLPIGKGAGAFTGVFDGNGHTIRGLTYDAPTENDLGLFAAVAGGTIKNLTLSELTIDGGETLGGLAGSISNGATISHVTVAGHVRQNGGFVSGLLVGAARDSLIEDCHTSGVIDIAPDSHHEVGGLIGKSGTLIVRKSSSDAAVTGHATVGGLIGNAGPQTVIETCSATGTVRAIFNGGGLVGTADDISISDAFASGDVIVAMKYGGGLLGRDDGSTDLVRTYASGAVGSGDTLGGLVGRLGPGSSISRSFASGQVSGSAKFAIGGLVGELTGSISESYAEGDAGGAEQVGGLVGILQDGGSVADAYARGDVQSSLGKAAGLVGEAAAGTVRRAYSLGSVLGASNVGGLAGLVGTATFTDCIWDTEASGEVTSAAGTGLSSSAMQTQSSFTNWDFAAIWAMPTSVGAAAGPPLLRWAATPSQ